MYDLSTRPQPYRAIPLPDRLNVPVRQFFTGETVGTVWLDPATFGIDDVRVDIIHQVVTYQRNTRWGKRLARPKTVSEISGSGRKVRPQKGQGRARAGHSRPPHWRGGVKIHGPKGILQDYETSLNKKVRRMGMRNVLSQKLKEGNIMVVSDMKAETHKTVTLGKALDRFDIGGKFGAAAFFVDHADDDDESVYTQEDEEEEGKGEREPRTAGGVDINFKVASGNIRRIRLVNQLGANVYDILRHEKLVLSLTAVRALEERLA